MYVLKSDSYGKFYVGSTGSLVNRVKKHNSGQVASTKYGIPWQLVLKEEFLTRNEAYAREFQIKGYKGGEAFKKLLKVSLSTQ